jgi:hypothetical protein
MAISLTASSNMRHHGGKYQKHMLSRPLAKFRPVGEDRVRSNLIRKTELKLLMPTRRITSAVVRITTKLHKF